MTTTTPYQTAAPVRTLSVTSFVIGLSSIVFGWTLVAPVAGLVLGILALKREPLGRTFAIWGIVLNAVMLAGAAIGIAFAVVGLGVGLMALPFAWL
ncbi:hypothetical protein [Leifsonia virtsii]|uniref:DUF4190 domain-containing protein n=1 Tax=Leifsonia virtsii TaxID=3035915 RepID=A0ABT8J1H8_9MICO|nr:hypothetical protein [Leifsonia virtsii]MDN4598807.1 hypothetical protein [Leifsonia virtsii]